MSVFKSSVASQERKPQSLWRTVKIHSPAPGPATVEFETQRMLAAEAHFVQVLSLERKRAERSGQHFLLMLLEGWEVFGGQQPDGQMASAVTAALGGTIRETDLFGWYRQAHTLGVIFTEVNSAKVALTVEALNAKVEAALRDRLKPDEVDRIEISFHLFPETTDRDGWQAPKGSVLYPDVRKQSGARKLALLTKRLVDFGGGATALLVFSPLFALIAAAVKLTSKGPILYRQVRIGQYGRRFTFLKFRSMYVNSSAAVHQEFVKGLIQGKGKPNSADKASGPLYKIRHDQRVTSLGRWLRKTSLDELPQFLNVLKGEMSLVGPRPPIPYEVEAYNTWHRRRLLDAKPGVTGLWQVSGRSRTTFDEMVRLDLRYAKGWSLWLDLRILAQTPRAVLSGEGAF
jgi:lipopolysaccharide/colanic/teichoic acid biosynthesis glycosyltransferase